MMRPFAFLGFGLCVAVGCSSSETRFQAGTSASTAASSGSGASGGSGGGAGSTTSSSNAGTGGFDPGGTSGAGGKEPLVNLVPNGDFSQGNTQFASDYLFATSNTIEGEYTVTTSPQLFNGSLVNVGDHTTGNGNMFGDDFRGLSGGGR